MVVYDPEEVIWVAMLHRDVHEILQALNDPLDGGLRVEKTDSENSPASLFQIDYPGFTDICTLGQLHDKMLS